MNIKKSVLASILIGVAFVVVSADRENFSAAMYDSEQFQNGCTNPVLNGQFNTIMRLKLEQAPHERCLDEACCHGIMQACYDRGGGTECSDQYKRCVKRL